MLNMICLDINIEVEEFKNQFLAMLDSHLGDSGTDVLGVDIVNKYIHEHVLDLCSELDNFVDKVLNSLKACDDDFKKLEYIVEETRTNYVIVINSLCIYE